MKVSVLLSSWPVLGALVSASPLTRDPLEGRDTCGAVKSVVSLLKIGKATPFCSSFISITPVTRTQTVTTTQTATTTTEVTETTAPTVVQTETARATITSTSTTGTTTVTATTTAIGGTTTSVDQRTITTTKTTTTTVPPTPATSTVYTQGPLRRSPGGVQERAVSIPPYLTSIASSAISQGCSCLSLPTPTTTTTTTSTARATITTTVTNTVTSPVTRTATDTVTSTDVVGAEATDRVTTTVSTIITVSTTATSTVTETSTATTTGAQATVTAPYPAQVVRNPSFEEGANNRDVSNWSGILGFDQAFSFPLSGCGDSLCPVDGDRSIDFVGDAPGGTTSIQQTLEGVQPGHSYTFSCYVGFYNGGIPNNPTNSFITVFLDGVAIVAEQQTCNGQATCNLKGNQYYGWRKITVNGVVPTTKNPVLRIQERLDIPQGFQAQDSLLDLVTLTRN